MITAQQIKAYARSLGADICGIAPVERFKNAPIRISPKGHLPTAKSVIVAAVHTPDGAWELGGEPIHNWGTASVVTAVNSRLERIAFFTARLLEENGYKSIPIPQTAIWRYRPYEDLNIVFSPDLSHIHAAAAAGLGEIGFNGLLLTPEFGARQRLITIITEAELDADPLYEGEPLCDRCMECVKNCAPSKGLKAEVNGLTRVDIGGKIFEYANKNKFRCAWAERFQIKFDMDIPDKVDENVIVPNLACNREGYGSSLEPCWRYCLPSNLRKRKDGRKPNHRLSFWVPNAEIKGETQVSRALTCEIERVIFDKGLDLFGVAGLDSFRGLDDSKPFKLNMIPFPFNERWGTVGADPARYLDDVKSVVVFGGGYPAECSVRKLEDAQNNSSSDKKPMHLLVSGLAFKDEYTSSGAAPLIESAIKEKIMDSILDISRYLEELGYSSVGLTYLADNYAAAAAGLGKLDNDGSLITVQNGTRQIYTALLTSAPLSVTPNISCVQAENSKKRTVTSQEIKNMASRKGITLTGISGAGRFNGIKETLRGLYDEKALGLSVIDRNERMGGYNVDAEIMQKENVFKDPWDYLKDAKSVIVIGTNIPRTILERAEMPPAESVGVYSMFAHHAAWQILNEAAAEIIKHLNSNGYKAVPTEDLNGTATKVAHTFGEIIDMRANAYAAMFAGLADMGMNGQAVTAEYGTAQRFFAIVTDAELEQDEVKAAGKICSGCAKCAAACNVGAIGGRVTAELNGIGWKQGKLDGLRCDWCKRYAFVGSEGPKFMGSRTDIMPPEKIDAEKIVEAMKKMDPLQKRIPCIVENCVLACPLTYGSGK